MKHPVDFRPEKPRIELPNPATKPSVRLPAALTAPDGQTMYEAPTLDLGDVFPSLPPETDMNSSPAQETMTKETTKTELPRMPKLLGRSSMADRRIIGSGTLFQRGDLLDRLDEIVGEAEIMQGKFQSELDLPDVPPLPNWEEKPVEIESVTFDLPDTSTPTVTADSLEEFLYGPTKTTPKAAEPEKVPKKSVTLTLRPHRPAVFRRPVRPVRSLELILPQPQQQIPQQMPAPEIETPPSPQPAPPFPSRPGSGELLLTQDLTKSYYKKKLKIPVLKGVNFFVNPGEFVSIVGQSGSGKSTLLHLLGTLDAPESGSIYFEGGRIDNLPFAKRDLLRNRSIGFIFQFYHLLPELSTLENVLSPLMIRESAWSYFFKRKQYIEKAKAILEQVGLSHRLKHKPCELSGGEMQRAAIARALISEPKILLADEPTGNLDSASAREIITLLRRLKDERNLTIVMVTHDNLIARTADRIVRMVDGVIVSSDGG